MVNGNRGGDYCCCPWTIWSWNKPIGRANPGAIIPRTLHPQRSKAAIAAAAVRYGEDDPDGLRRETKSSPISRPKKPAEVHERMSELVPMPADRSSRI